MAGQLRADADAAGCRRRPHAAGRSGIDVAALAAVGQEADLRAVGVRATHDATRDPRSAAAARPLSGTRWTCVGWSSRPSSSEPPVHAAQHAGRGGALLALADQHVRLVVGGDHREGAAVRHPLELGDAALELGQPRASPPSIGSSHTCVISFSRSEVNASVRAVGREARPAVGPRAAGQPPRRGRRGRGRSRGRCGRRRRRRCALRRRPAAPSGETAISPIRRCRRRSFGVRRLVVGMRGVSRIAARLDTLGASRCVSFSLDPAGASTHSRGGWRVRRCWASCTPRPETPGSGSSATLHDVAVGDHEGLTELAGALGADLVVVGPEAPLVGGLADRLEDAGIAAFGPAARRPRSWRGRRRSPSR